LRQAAAGKQAKRRQRRMKRACFEEAARLAATKRPGIVMPQRWANAPDPAQGVEPPFSFRGIEKKTAVHGQKKRYFLPQILALRASVRFVTGVVG